jgi:2-oxoglutarate ferredoxin oxidoreductase subunit alpha
MHRIGGLEKQDVTGNVSYDAANHQHMTDTRARKVAGIEVAPCEVQGAETGDVLVLGWGGTAGAITAATQRMQKAGHAVSAVSLRHLNPFPPNLGTLLGAFRRVIVPELNGGQLAMLVRAQFLVDARPFTKVQGQPFTSHEIEARIEAALQEIER